MKFVSWMRKRFCGANHRRSSKKNVQSEYTKREFVETKRYIPLKEYFGLTYTLVKTEGLDEYLASLGLNFVKRKIAVKILPDTFELNYESGHFVLYTFSNFLKLELEFKLNEEMELKTPDGRLCKVVYSFEPPNKLVEVQKSSTVNRIVRYFSQDDVVMQFNVNSTVCRMYFERILKTDKSPKLRFRSRSLTPFHHYNCIN
ncbi:fatty acid-binding protein, muscle-like isoform X1 [Cimex lectularius]|uniref:Uncharacterized protein n=1 Tax=Cimex lectularius TaxID=79782 RepID=A0A8I6SIY9_CIMLE|nr:fatty acid-binding protein, muscle-like isoform X1 [Cimex lectularius]XP_014248325.1 fatty acid-binding protein, muscle-like isoform X1 [Cimex lectularius]XP_014248326.1 fatty acid-binding protein, muscle-like isoform X1 [Cimex lectularius]XP_014248327.1 fatty acid-binding protein, muscle-like isoform X1 [Cimex lectularius]XP_024083365.1 fatty acid-binding protein, muscle-like isoform X1 [Cimex lectularius]